MVYDKLCGILKEVNGYYGIHVSRFAFEIAVRPSLKTVPSHMFIFYV